MSICRIAAFVIVMGSTIALASPSYAQTATASCEAHFYPAAKLHSVGEDFDQVKRVDQDLRMYDQAAGKSLDWLNSARQTSLVEDGLARRLTMFGTGKLIVHDPLTRLQAVDPARPAAGATGCVLEIATPQLIMERGGLATRSLRVFGVVRHFENGTMVSRFAGFSSAPLPGFRMTNPSEAEAATRLVEQAYIEAMEALYTHLLETKPATRP